MIGMYAIVALAVIAAGIALGIVAAISWRIHCQEEVTRAAHAVARAQARRLPVPATEAPWTGAPCL
jgi:hypothetical protein